MAAAKKIKFNDDGTTDLPLYDADDKLQVVKLPEPRVKHVKKLEGLADSLDDQARPVRAEATALGAKRSELLLDEDNKRRTLSEKDQRGLAEIEEKIAELMSEVRDVNNNAAAEWLATAVQDLLGDDADGYQLGADDLPSWALDPSLPRQVIKHWKSAPLAPSS